MIGIWIGTYTYQTYEIIANLQLNNLIAAPKPSYQTYEIIANLQLNLKQILNGVSYQTYEIIANLQPQYHLH